MKKINDLFILLLILILGSCTSESNDQRQSIVGTWFLTVCCSSWDMHEDIPRGKLVYQFQNNGIVEVRNETGLSIDPFISTGIYHYQINSANSITIDDVKYEYFFKNPSILILSKDMATTGAYSVLSQE